MESVLETDARERGRLAALHEYDLLDAPAGDELDAVVRVAAMVAGVPTATLNLIDEHRQCQLTTVGFDGADSDRKDSMCAVRFETGDFVYVPDASKDRTYAENPWVTGILADVRFYASAPLITPRGHALGTLCVFDSRPRELSTDQIDRLKDLAVTILALFERRRQARRNLELAAEADRRQQQLEVERQRLDDERTFLQTLLDSLDTGVAACDSEGRLTLFNEALRKIHGADEQPFAAEDWPLVYSLLAEDGRTLLRPDEVPLARAFTGEVIRGEQLVLRHREGEMHRFLINARPIDTRDGRRLGAVAAMHDITGTYRAELRRRAAHAVAQALSEATSAADAAAAAAAAAAEELGWACAEYWEIEPAQQQVRRSSSWTRPGLNLSPFTGHTDLSFERGEGLAGTVWERGAPVWSSDMVADAAIAGRLGAARDCGLHTAIGLPVRTADGIVGALAFFTDTVLPPDPDILSLLDSITAHVGRYVERRRAEELALALATARRDFDRVIERVDDYVWTIEIIAGGAARSVYASPNGRAVFGGSLPTVDDPAAQLAARVHPADQAAFADFRATISDGRPADVEIRILGYDGVTRWVWTRASSHRPIRRRNRRLRRWGSSDASCRRRGSTCCWMPSSDLRDCMRASPARARLRHRWPHAQDSGASRIA